MHEMHPSAADFMLCGFLAERNTVLAKNTVQDRGSNAITCGYRLK